MTDDTSPPNDTESAAQNKALYNKLAIGFFVVVAILVIARQLFLLSEPVSIKTSNSVCKQGLCVYTYTLINNTSDPQSGEVYIYFRDKRGIGSVHTSTEDAQYTTATYALETSASMAYGGELETSKTEVEFVVVPE